MRGIIVEELAEILLKELGFEVKERRKTVTSDDVNIAEIDMIAEKEGITYAVEVKSGKVSTSDIRHAYANSALINAKPMIICRGFSDKGAEEAAKQLGVKVITFPTYYFFASPEELSHMIEKALERVMLRIFSGNVSLITPEDYDILRALAYSFTFNEAAKMLGLSKEELIKKLVKLKKRNILTTTSNYDLIRLQSLLLIKEYEVRAYLKAIQRKLDNITL